MYINLTGYSWWTSLILVSPPHQRTPLHKAAKRGHVGAVEYLLQAGADVNIQGDDGVSE